MTSAPRHVDVINGESSPAEHGFEDPERARMRGRARSKEVDAGSKMLVAPPRIGRRSDDRDGGERRWSVAPGAGTPQSGREQIEGSQRTVSSPGVWGRQR
jgi:hypothetical protein